ncbi:MAG: Nif3-like dinuclear metal center hexameric protein [Deltaproteobacteria bacterium]|nr:Nif3-like dinuclear metal center hexameric protein [Candidatus Tharpella aukensis]
MNLDSDGHSQINHGSLIDFLQTRIPFDLSESWDNCGLQAGSRRWPLQGVLCCLDFSCGVIAEAQDVGANFIFSHHPLFFKPLQRLDLDVFPGNLLHQALRAGITLYSAHTNLDSVAGGVNDHLAQLLGVTGCLPLTPHFRKLYKLVTFVPSAEVDRVGDALFAAGAGRLGEGRYSECSFRSAGVGSFHPAPGAAPKVGEIGRKNLVDEIRFETVLDQDCLASVLEGLQQAHPYEVPAYDLYPMQFSDKECGSGRIGELENDMSLKEFADLVKLRLGTASLRLIGGEPERRVKKIALCGGSGFSFYKEAQAAGADLFITGDIKYHEAREVIDQDGIPILDAGHFATERPVLEGCAAWCREFLSACKTSIPVTISHSEREPWVVL